MKSAAPSILNPRTTLASLLVWVALSAVACAPKCSDTAVPNASDSVPAVKPELSPLVACVDRLRAMAHVERVVAFAPRHAGTSGLEETRKYIEKELQSVGLSPVRHSFTAHTPHKDVGSVPLANISVTIPGTEKKEKRILLSGHFDGKLIDGVEFVGANDGGSSTAVLLEMARCLHEHPSSQTVQLVFFDGEEALVDWTDSDSLYGSKHFAALLAETGDHKKISALVNIDMVGDPNLRFVDEQNSSAHVFAALRQSAEQLGRSDLFGGQTMSVADDHLPFLELGIPAANLIDFFYGPGWNSNQWWHTADDNMSNISAESLQITGQLVLNALHSLSKEPE
jgi:glutaminyl-peptide cyclotransferase